MFMPSLITYLSDNNDFINAIPLGSFWGEKFFAISFEKQDINDSLHIPINNKHLLYLENPTLIFGFDEINEYDIINSLNNELYQFREILFIIKVIFYAFLIYNLNIFGI